MTPTLSTDRPLVKPTHFALAIAAVAVASSVCMAVGDPFAATIPTPTVTLVALDRDEAADARDLGQPAPPPARPRRLAQ